MISGASKKAVDRRLETLLVVDDDPKIHPLIDFHLEGVVEKILHAKSPIVGLRMAREHLPDVVLLDIDMPRMDGYTWCRELKSDDDTRDSQVLFLTVESEEHQIVRALDSGGADYVTKPFNVVVLQARVRAALRTKRLIDLLKREARVDGLTGLPNRRVFEETLERYWSEHERHSEDFAVVVLDLDHFKSINDEFGHGIGDEVLRLAGKTMQSSRRGYELTYRFGGDEFVMLLRGVDEEGAVSAVERILDAIAKMRVKAGDREVGITASAGIANMSAASPALGTAGLLETADAALYRAKAEGRARLVSVSVESS
jgi:diguanylate cyclase (GGDEF)-like protein